MWILEQATQVKSLKPSLHGGNPLQSMFKTTLYTYIGKKYYKCHNLTLMCGLTIEFYLDLRIKINLEQGE
jgi:hypothetical protein